jgi:menaquinone-specific isochorismate synthase
MPVLNSLRAHARQLPPDQVPLRLAGNSGFAWRSGHHELVGLGVAARVPLDTGPGRLAKAGAEVAALLDGIGLDGERGAPGPVAVGALPFADQAQGELVVPELLVRRGPDGVVWCVTVRPEGAPPTDLPLPVPLADGRLSPLTLLAVQDRRWWRQAVERALAAIEAGSVGKVVLARELLVEAERPFSRAALLAALAGVVGSGEGAAGGLLYAMDGLVGASPELLVRREGRAASSCPLAGTAPRGATPAEEAALLARLTASAKDADEHRFVVEAVAEALAEVSDDVQVQRREVVSLATVTHLATRIEAKLREPVPSALDLVALLHPTPAVAGTPTAAALDLIAELEPFQRGRYGGPVGWVDAAGDGEWAVALRGAELSGRRARLLAGAGIVPGSEPGAEWAETEAKLAAMLAVLGG